MATTGFWPVRGNLKKVLDYADNPDKTTDRKYLDNDLYDALRYTENDDKTDERKYVSTTKDFGILDFHFFSNDSVPHCLHLAS